MKKIILVNGPPSSGKDTAANYLYGIIPRSRLFKLAAPLRRIVAATFDLTSAEIVMFEQEPQKSTPHVRFYGKSYRQALIDASERYLKQVYSQQIMGDLAAHEIARSTALVHICSDSGFDYEAAPLVKLVGADNVLLLRMHRDGCTFDGDSRSLIHLPGVRTLDITNNTSHEQLYKLLGFVVPAWLEINDGET